MIYHGDYKKDGLPLKNCILSIDPAAGITFGQAGIAIHVAFFM